MPTFHSVILAGVHDIRILKHKIRPDEEHKVKSPWNIAVPFTVDMSLSEEGIAGMLADYEQNHYTGMDIAAVAKEIRDYTSLTVFSRQGSIITSSQESGIRVSLMMRAAFLRTASLRAEYLDRHHLQEGYLLTFNFNKRKETSGACPAVARRSLRPSCSG